MTTGKTKTIGVTAFKAKCLGLVDEVAKGKTSKVILTRRGKPVAELNKVSAKPTNKGSTFGALKGMLKLDPDFDLTAPSTEFVDWGLDNPKLYNE
jgi:prevent-host-death family protein